MNNNFFKDIEIELFNNCKTYFPRFMDGVTKTRVDLHDSSCLILTYVDGSEMLYDDMDHTIRLLPHPKNTMTKDEILSEFGIRLTRIMDRKNVTQLELADMTNISNITLSKYMNGQMMPGLYAFDKIARALNCSADEFRYL